MNDARRRDQIVRCVGLKVELGRSQTDGQIYRPDAKAGEGSHHIEILEVQVDASELDELEELP